MRISDWSSDVCSSDLQQLQDGCLLGLDAGNAAELGPDGAQLTAAVREFDPLALVGGGVVLDDDVRCGGPDAPVQTVGQATDVLLLVVDAGDRKSTRLNSSH